MTNLLPLEIWQEILEYTNFIDQIHLRMVCRDMYFLKIYDFYNIPYKYKYRLNDDIIKLHPYIKYLDASNNKQITSVNHCTQLQKLDASYYCGISDDGFIHCTQLTVLNATYNNKITRKIKKIEISL